MFQFKHVYFVLYVFSKCTICANMFSLISRLGSGVFIKSCQIDSCVDKCHIIVCITLGSPEYWLARATFFETIDRWPVEWCIIWSRF